jgi:nitrous oxide reductase accessory protein NosL
MNLIKKMALIFILVFSLFLLGCEGCSDSNPTSPEQTQNSNG